MSTTQPQPVPTDEPADSPPGLFADWMTREGAWWACSFVFHMLLMCAFLLMSSRVRPPTEDQGAPSFDEANLEDMKADQAKTLQEKFEVGNTPIEPTELNTDTLTLNQASSSEPVTADYIDNSATYSPAGGGGIATAATNQPLLGGLGSFSVRAFGSGPMVRGGGGVGVGIGTGGGPGSGGSGTGFGGRGSGARKAMVGGFGGTKQTERAVAAALHWIARHQLPDGRWSLGRYQMMCTKGDQSCAGSGDYESDSAATALGLLPFLAAGQTHKTRGPYRMTIYKGLYWLLRQQARDGDLSGGAKGMYAHGLCTIALCEAVGLTADPQLRGAAQRAILFIQAAQHKTTGGWRYNPGQDGDTSVVGWQVMALKSAMMAGIQVPAVTFEGAKRWLKSVSSGAHHGQFSYTPDSGATPTMTAVGLLCSQYMSLKREDPVMVEGMQMLMSNMPNPGGHNIYYWYYATQVLHNVPGVEWDTWNRQMRRVLIESQEKDGCAAGSWNPLKPNKDLWSDTGGRLMLTSLSALTLEVYYRYLPLYKLDSETALRSGRPLSKSVIEKIGMQSVESAMTKPASELEKEKKAAADKAAKAAADKAKAAEKPAAPPADKKADAKDKK
jgi:hypothetical protein